LSGVFTPPDSLAAIREFLAECSKDNPWILGLYGSPANSRGAHLQHHDDLTAGIRRVTSTEG